MNKSQSQIPKDKLDLYDKLIATNPNIERKGVTSPQYVKGMKPKPTKKKSIV